MKDLEIRSNSIKDFTSYPPGLQSLSLNLWEYYPQSLLIFPDEIKNLTLHLSPVGLNSLPIIPINLISLNMSVDIENYSLMNEFSKMSKLKNLSLSFGILDSIYLLIPPNIKELHLIAGDTFISIPNLLSKRIQSLYLKLIGSKINKLEAFPDSLLSLSLYFAYLNLDTIPKFPLTLKSLTMDFEKTSVKHFPSLPPTIQNLTFYVNDQSDSSFIDFINSIDWPKDLPSLNIFIYKNKNLDIDPPFITKLYVGIINNFGYYKPPDSD